MDNKELNRLTAERNGIHPVCQGTGWALANKNGVTIGPYWGKSADEAWAKQCPNFCGDMYWVNKLVEDFHYLIKWDKVKYGVIVVHEGFSNGMSSNEWDIFTVDKSDATVGIATINQTGVGTSTLLPHAITIAWNDWWEKNHK